MKTEFEHIELDQIRYSIVWEDFNTVLNGLQMGEEDNLLCITSAGCNVLNSALLPVKTITAIDMNKVQNNLLRLKLYLINHGKYSTYSKLLGLEGVAGVQQAWKEVSAKLDSDSRVYWEGFILQHPYGLLMGGKLEKYLTHFFSTLNKDFQEKIERLFTFKNINDQFDFFTSQLDVPDFREAFINYFNQANLSKGRDPKLFKYATENSGEIFYQRFAHFVWKFVVQDNFYLRFFFFGIEGIPQSLLPLCYQEKYFVPLKKNIHKISIVDGEAISFLLSDKGRSITKASLSNIFEYTDQKEFKNACYKLASHHPSLTFLYWNLLQVQVHPEHEGFDKLGFDKLNLTGSLPLTQESCFYFHDAQLVTLKRNNLNTTTMENINEFLSTAFVEELMLNHSPSKSIRVTSVERFEMDNSASILVTLTTGQTNRLIGHFGLTVTYLENGIQKKQNMVMKIKPHGQEITSMLNGLAQAVGGELSLIYEEHKERTGFRYTHLREQEIYTKRPSPITPTIFGTVSDPKNERYIILMEYLEEVELLNAVMAPEKFSDQHIKAALSQIALWHAQNFDRHIPLDKNLWSDSPSSTNMTELMPLWKALLSNAAIHFPTLYTQEFGDLLDQAIDNIPEYWKELDRLPKTLVHNDFNPRNICFKKEDGGFNLCAYDWELATFHIPQYDVVEFLCFVLDKDRYHLRDGYVEYYRLALNQHIPSFNDPKKFKKEFDMAALDFGLHRLGMYMMAHTLSPYPFLPRVVESFFDTLNNSELYFLKVIENKA